MAEELAGHAGGVEAAVVGLGRLLARRLLVEVLGAADHLRERPTLRSIASSRVAAGGRRSSCHGLRGRLADLVLARRGHDRRERAHPLRVLDGDGLGDHPAHRRADDVGGVDAERVEEADAVGGHVGQPVRHLDRLALRGRQEAS